MQLILIKKMNHASALIELLVVTTIGGILCCAATQQLLTIIGLQHKIQRKFQANLELLITRHYLGTDIYGNCSGITICNSTTLNCAHSDKPEVKKIGNLKVKPGSDIIILESLPEKITYYIRPSIIKNSLNTPNFALYRDDNQHKAQAIAEDIQDLHATTRVIDQHRYLATIFIKFSNQKILELACIFWH